MTARSVTPDGTESCRSLNVSLISSSVHKYLNYSKKMQVRLAEINNNISSVIKESCTGIDNICNRVRQCLFEMDQRERMYLADDITEYEIVDEGVRSIEELSQEIEESASQEIQQTISQEINATILQVNRTISQKIDGMTLRETDGTISQELDENVGDASSAEILGGYKKASKHRISQDMQSLSPFFTIINCDSKGDLKNTESCKKQILSKTIYSLMNKDDSMIKLQDETESEVGFEHFKETINTLCDNFDMMNKLVENINKEIEQFSETAIPIEEKHEKENEEKEKNTSQLRPIKRLSKNNSHQKSVQVGDCLTDSDVDLDYIELNGRNSSSFLIPDVYRKRAFTNLYQRLIDQLEANDSLIFFQTLMKRQNKYEEKSSNENRLSQIKLNVPIMNYSVPKKPVVNSVTPTPINQTPKKVDLTKKYTGSLWFCQKRVLKENVNTRSTSRRVPKKDSSSKNRIVENKSLSEHAPSEKKNRNKKTKMAESAKSLKQTNQSSKVQNTCPLECTCRMVVQNDMPPSPSTKCHLQWLKAKTSQAPRKIKFLDILDDLTNRDLLPLQSEYPRKDNLQPRELDYKDIQDTYLYKLLYGKQSTKNAWKQLLEPMYSSSKKNCKVQRCTISKKPKEEKNNESFMEKFSTQNYSKSDILKRLSPYIFDPEKQEGSYSQSVIVMPVRVFYDNLKMNEPPTKLKNPNKSSINTVKRSTILPTKEAKSLKRPEWCPPGIAKAMKVVYNGLPTKPEDPCSSRSTKTSITSGNPVTSSARLYLHTERSQLKKETSRSLSPPSLSPYSSTNKNIKNDNVSFKRQENSMIYNRIQMDIEKIKNDLYGKRISNADRKLWANKYGKSVGQKLITYVQHQEPEQVHVLPRYALPTVQIQTTPPDNRGNISDELYPRKQMLSQVPKNLRTKNNVMQNNIQKTLEVIESQMVDILCDDSNSVDAFDIMEKEITQVLSQMKCDDKKALRIRPIKCSNPKDNNENTSLEKDYNIISDQLFDRLQKILDTGGSSVPTTPTEQNTKRKQLPRRDKDDVRKKQKLSSHRRKKRSMMSSSTSASIEEKSFIRRSPRLSPRKKERTDAKPKPAIVVLKEPRSLENEENIYSNQDISKTVPAENENYIAENDTKVDMISRVSDYHFLDTNEEDIVKNDTDEFYDVETDFSVNDNVASDDKVQKLVSENIPESIENSDTHNYNVSRDIEDFISDELNKAINQAKIVESFEMKDYLDEELNRAVEKEICRSDENKEMEYFIKDELSKTVEEEIDKYVEHAEMKDFIREELNEAMEQGITRSVENTEMREYIDSELSKFVENAEVKGFIHDELNKALDQEIHRSIETKDMKDLIKDELDKAIKKAEKLAERNEIKEFINGELINVIKQVETGTIPDSNASVPATKTDVEEFINDELNKAIQKAEMLASAIPDSMPHTNVPKSVTDSDMEGFVSEEINKVIDSLITVSEGTSDERLEHEETASIKSLEEELDHDIPLLESMNGDTNFEVQMESSSSSAFSEHIHKIIRRVEDIYSHLDDIQNSDDMERIPVFRETNISDIRSDIFLTPFMQAVKETRRHPKDLETMETIEKSPSFYNVMCFLDTLSNIQKEVPYEVHKAYLLHYVYLCHQTAVYYQTELWQEVQRSSNNCLEKIAEEKKQLKHRKVSFLEAKTADKSSQATLCPFHKAKPLRISSQQFPPLESPTEDKQTSRSNPINQHGDTPACKSKQNSEVSQKPCPLKHMCGENKDKNSVPDNAEKKPFCEVHSHKAQKPFKVPSCKSERELICIEPEKCTKNEVGCVETNTDASKIDDKSTQVFCQAHKKECSTDPSFTDDKSNDEASVDCAKYMEDNPDDSNSTGKDLDDSLVDPFYDYSNDNITPKAVMQKIGDIYEEDKAQTQPKIVVFREVLEIPSPHIKPSLKNIENIEPYKRRLEKRKEIRVLRKASSEVVKYEMPKVQSSSENVVLLKSFYAIVYILMFTALSLDYRCL